MHLLTTILLLIFSTGILFGFYVVFEMIIGERKKWQLIYIISLVLLFLIISQIMPDDYKNPFKKGDPTAEDFERGYIPDENRDQDIFNY